MADSDVLTNAFLASHPDDAARVLEQLPAEDAAALFERAPVRLGAPALGAMLPYTAARCVQRLDTAHAAMLLAAISLPATAAVLRHVPEAARTLLLDALPTGASLACQALLGYPEDSVGACVDTEVIAMNPEGRVVDALEAVRAARIMPIGPVYVIDGQRRPLGQIEMPVLLRADAQGRLDMLMSAVPATLPAATPLAGAAAHPVWLNADVVPVVERGGGLVGVAQRRALHHAQRARGSGEAPAPESLTEMLATGYWHAVVGLVDATLSVLAPRPRERR